MLWASSPGPLHAALKSVRRRLVVPPAACRGLQCAATPSGCFEHPGRGRRGPAAASDANSRFNRFNQGAVRGHRSRRALRGLRCWSTVRVAAVAGSRSRGSSSTGKAGQGFGGGPGVPRPLPGPSNQRKDRAGRGRPAARWHGLANSPGAAANLALRSPRARPQGFEPFRDRGAWPCRPSASARPGSPCSVAKGLGADAARLSNKAFFRLTGRPQAQGRAPQSYSTPAVRLERSSQRRRPSRGSTVPAGSRPRRWGGIGWCAWVSL